MRAFLRKLFRQPEPRLFLGSITVVPTEEGMDSELRDKLQQLFGLPNADSVSELTPADMALDIYVPDYRIGMATVEDLDEFGALPILLRPRIELRAHLHYLQSGKTRRVLSIKRKMRLGKGVSRLFSLRAWFGTSAFDEDDVEALLYEACQELLDRLKAYC